MLRTCVEEDIEKIYEIYIHSSVNPFMDLKPMPFDEFREYWTKRMLSEEAYVWDEEKDVKGMVCLKMTEGRCAGTVQLGSLAVAPGQHGQGIGKKIMASVLELLKNRGFARVQLLVEEDNENGRAFYKKIGFKEEGRLEKDFNREGTWVAEIVMGYVFKVVRSS